MTEKQCENLSAASADKVELGIASLRDVVRDAARNYSQNSDVNQAAAIAFYAILSLIPLFLLTLLVAGRLFGTHPDVQDDILKTIRSIHPFFSQDILNHLARVKESNLVGGLGIVSLIWFSTMIFGALEKALDIIFRTTSPRNLLESKLLAVAMIPLGWIVGITSMGITYLASAAERQSFFTWSGLSYGYALVFNFLLPYFLAIAFITLIYRVIPTGKVTLRGAVGGAVVFATLMEAAKQLLTWYITNHTRYDVIFGSMGSLVLLVIWVFYISIVLLFCAELVSSYERRDLVLLEEAFLTPKNKALKTDERLFRKFGRFYPCGSYLFREGDSGSEMFYILQGSVTVEKKTEQGRKKLAEIGPGSYLGEMAALIDASRTASAFAAEDSHVAVINGSIFRDVLRESEGVSLFMLQEFSRRIVHTNDTLQEVTREWIKLVVALYFFNEWPLRDDVNPIQELNKLTGKEMGEIETIFQSLNSQGILVMEGDKVSDFRKDKVWDLLPKP